MDRNEQFIRELGRCRDPVEFLGIATILNVKVVEEDKPRSTLDIMSDVIDNYAAASTKVKKAVIKILRAANKRGK